MANFYKNLQFKNLNTGNLMTLDNNNVMTTTNIPVANLQNTINTVSNLSERVTNLENITNTMVVRLENINGEVI